MALNWVKLHLKTLLIWVLVLIDSRWCETWNTFFSLIHSFIIISAFMELLCCLCVNMHWSVFSCVSSPPHLRVWIYMYIRLNLEKERQRARETKWHRERKETSVDFPSRDRGVPLGSLSGTLGFDAAPAASSLTPTATPSDTSGDRHSQITWIAIVSRSSKRNHLKKTFDAPSASFPALSHRRPLWWASWQRLGPSRPEDIFVSCCLGQFNWEANLLPLLLIHTHTHTVSSVTNGVSLQNVVSRVRTQIAQDFIPTMAVAVHSYDRLQRKYSK